MQEEELAEDRLWPHDPDGESWAPSLPLHSKKRGRPKVPEMWTRVVSIVRDPPENLKVYEIQKDQETIDDRL